MRDPVGDIRKIERLREDIARLDAGALELVDHRLRVVSLAAEHLVDARRVAGLEFRRVLDAEALVERDALLQREQRAAAGVQIRAPGGRAAEIAGGRGGGGVRRIHLALQCLELRERDVAGAAARAGVRAGPWRGAARVELGVHDVGGGVQVAFVVAAHELAVLRERHVAFDDARAHARAGFVGFLRVFGKLQRRAAMRNREVGAAERTVLALEQPRLERPCVHALHQVERARAELDGLIGAFVVAVVIIVIVARQVALTRKTRDRSCRDGGNRCVAHGFSQWCCQEPP